MADSTPTPSNNTSSVARSSSFQRTVCLYDWWLVKAENDFEGKRLAVAGILSEDTNSPFMKETMRCLFLLLLSKHMMCFPSRLRMVFNCFLFGFPPNWESCAVDCFGEESTTGIDLGSAVTANVPAIDPEILSDGVESTDSVSPEEASGGHEKPFTEDECNVSKEMGGVNVADGSGGNRRRTRLHNIEVCQQKKKPASLGPPKHPDKEQSPTSGALENPDGEGLKSPVTPIQSQSLGQVNILPEQLVKKSASRISRTLSANTEGHYKKKRATVETPKRKMTKAASAVKYPQERDGSPLIKGGKQKISSVPPKSLSFRKSRSGRLLLPPLEFWRNQIPVYNVLMIFVRSGALSQK